MTRSKTHHEMVRDEIIRQWDERVAARAERIKRPLGMADVSDDTARQLWWLRNPEGEILVAQQGLRGWAAAKLIYPYRETILQAARARGGVSGMIRMSDRMAANQGVADDG